jgi:hypothetical protein
MKSAKQGMLCAAQALLGNGYDIFVRACTQTGLFGFLFAFITGFLVYGAALVTATILLKWIVFGRVPAGVHKYVTPPLCQKHTRLPVLKASSQTCHSHARVPILAGFAGTHARPRVRSFKSSNNTALT